MLLAAKLVLAALVTVTGLKPSGEADERAIGGQGSATVDAGPGWSLSDPSEDDRSIFSLDGLWRDPESGRDDGPMADERTCPDKGSWPTCY